MVSNELMREHYSLARYMAAEKRSRKEVFSLISSTLCRTDRKELRIQAANYNLCGVIFLFQMVRFWVFFFPQKISINTHNLEWTEITLEISEPSEVILKDTRQKQTKLTY